MKTSITIRPTALNEAYTVTVRVLVAGVALLDFTNIVDMDEPKELIHARFTAQIPQYETTAKQKAIDIFKELIA